MSELLRLGPEIVTAGLGLLLLLLGVLLKDRPERVLTWVAGLGALGAWIWNFSLPVSADPILGGLAVMDDFARFAGGLVLTATLLLIPGTGAFQRRRPLPPGEYFSLLFFAVTGLLVLVSAHSLLTVFLGIELLSISLYAQAGLLTTSRSSREAAAKYFLMGAFATGFLLFGISLIFGATGSLFLPQIVAQLSGEAAPGVLLSLGILLLLVGFAFKVAAVPFHFWTPDVYDGTPTIVTAFMATAVKVGALAVFARVFVWGLASGAEFWTPLLVVLAVLTMTVGNLTALVQTSIKRMLAYSAIAHAGYLLVGLLTAPHSQSQLQPLLFYLLPYILMNVGVFLLVIMVNERPGETGYALTDYRGLGLEHPFLGLLLTVFMLSLAGIPPTAGFLGKFYIFQAAVETNHLYLAVIGVLNALVSVYYYLRVVVYLYFHTGDQRPLVWSPGVAVVSTVTAVVVLFLGIYPRFLLQITDLIFL